MAKASFIEVWKDTSASRITLLDIEKMRLRKISRTPLQDAANLARMLMNAVRGDTLELLLGAMASANLPVDSAQEEKQRFVNICLSVLNQAEEWDREG